MINWEGLTQLIPPAIIITVMVFLVKFFGKAVSDQKPFADDRDWQRELDGINFFTRYILTPIVWVFIFKSKNFDPLLLTRYDFLLFLLSFTVFVSLIMVLSKSSDFILKNKVDDNIIWIGFKKSISNIISGGIILILLFFYSQSLYFYLLSGSIYFLIYLICIAILESIKKENIFIANIYLTNSEILENCRILKVNEDNVRLIKDNKLSLLFKSSILKIENVKTLSESKEEN